MPDYEKMYLHMVRETERAIQILIRAQQQCEQWYIDAPEPLLTLLPPGSADDPTP